MKIAFVHGKKLKRNGELHPELVSRLETAKKLLDKDKIDLILVSGGRTRKGCSSEAQMGYNYLVKNKIQKSKIVKLNFTHSTIDDVKAFF